MWLGLGLVTRPQRLLQEGWSLGLYAVHTPSLSFPQRDGRQRRSPDSLGWGPRQVRCGAQSQAIITGFDSPVLSCAWRGPAGPRRAALS